MDDFILWKSSPRPARSGRPPRGDRAGSYNTRGVHAGYLREGLLLGGAWLAITRALDAVILLPLSGMGAVEYMEQIGLRYLVIPIIAAGIGYAADRAVQTHGADPGSVMF